MPSKKVLLLVAASCLAMSACRSIGVDVRPPLPGEMPPMPQWIKPSLNVEQSLQGELLESAPPPTTTTRPSTESI